MYKGNKIQLAVIDQLKEEVEDLRSRLEDNGDREIISQGSSPRAHQRVERQYRAKDEEIE